MEKKHRYGQEKSWLNAAWKVIGYGLGFGLSHPGLLSNDMWRGRGIRHSSTDTARSELRKGLVLALSVTFYGRPM